MIEDEIDFEILAEKPVELDKEEFYKCLAKNGTLDLTVKRIGKTYISKWKNDKQKDYPSGFFIDYGFNIKETDFEVGISYNVGVPVKEELFEITSGMNIFKILEIAIDLERVEKAKFSKKFIEESLVGIRFKATLGTGFNGGFIIKPLERLE